MFRVTVQFNSVCAGGKWSQRPNWVPIGALLLRSLALRNSQDLYFLIFWKTGFLNFHHVRWGMRSHTESKRTGGKATSSPDTIHVSGPKNTMLQHRSIALSKSSANVGRKAISGNHFLSATTLLVKNGQKIYTALIHPSLQLMYFGTPVITLMVRTRSYHPKWKTRQAE